MRKFDESEKQPFDEYSWLIVNIIKEYEITQMKDFLEKMTYIKALFTDFKKFFVV